jgi:hypothetical protein
MAPFAYVKKALPGGTISLQVETTPVALVYSIFVVALHLCFHVASLTFKYTFVFSTIAWVDIISEILLQTVTITFLVSLVLSVKKNRNAITRIMPFIVQTDSILLEDSKEYYRNANISLIEQLLVLFIFLGTITLYDYIVWYSTVGVNILMYCPIYVDNLIEWIVVTQFMNMTVKLKDRYSLLNKRLSSFSGILETVNSNKGYYLPFLETACISVNEMKSQRKGKEILTINNIHEIMFDTALLVNSMYEAQNFLTILSAFTGMKIWSYFGLCFLFGYIAVEDTRVALSQMLWSSMRVAKLFCITIPCHSANNKMAQTVTVLRKLLLTFYADPATVTELERFSKHLSLRKFKFTVFGFLSLDLFLLASMVGTVVTYLMILMQFKLPANSPLACSKNVTVSDNADSTSL